MIPRFNSYTLILMYTTVAQDDSQKTAPFPHFYFVIKLKKYAIKIYIANFLTHISYVY